jgi:hypothetical protein
VNVDAITDLLLRPENLYLMAGVWILLEVLKRVAPRLVAHQLYIRLSPLLPLALCCAGVWIPGVADPAATAGIRILVGLVLGYTVAHSHKIVTQGILGRDPRLLKMPGAIDQGATTGGNGDDQANPPPAP